MQVRPLSGIFVVMSTQETIFEEKPAEQTVANWEEKREHHQQNYIFKSKLASQAGGLPSMVDKKKKK